MEEEEEEEVIKSSPATFTEESTTATEEQQPSVFPYIIFNYFSTQKTPSPPNQSPKSEDGWSKV
jgi:hypothetical protein